MQPLFSTELIVNDQPVLYNVVFENNQYHFKPASFATDEKEFCFIREHDEWKEQGEVAAPVAEQAIAKLEAYLLAQL